MASPRRTRTLPPNPSLEQHKKQAKELLNVHRSKDESICDRLRASLSGLSALSNAQILSAPLTLSDAQFVIAREHGFDSWAKFKNHLVDQASAFRVKVNEFLAAATPALDRDHRAGTLDQAEDLLIRTPELGSADIYAASIVGDHEAVRRHLEQDATLVTHKGGPHGWEPLQYVCFSRFLRANPERGDDFVQTARLLLAAGADPNAFFESNGEHETALYGAGGVARNPALTRLLLESGAEVNDDDLEYHAAEADDDSCLMLMAEFGLDLNRTGTSLLRKLDFDQIGTVKRLLAAGANPNAGLPMWGKNALHQAIVRERSIEYVRLLIDYGVDLDARTKDGKTAFALAGRRGRTDIMDLLRERGAETDLNLIDQFLSACATADEVAARSILAGDSAVAASVDAREAIVDAAAAGRTDSVRLMLDAGIPIYGPGDGAPTPLHQAAWHGRLETVEFLLARGAPTDTTERHYGGTALNWAIHGSASQPAHDDRRPEIVDRLIRAGAPIPEHTAGSEAVAAVLRRYGSLPAT